MSLFTDLDAFNVFAILSTIGAREFDIPYPAFVGMVYPSFLAGLPYFHADFNGFIKACLKI